ncbi:hypothetical protein AK88_04184 [Plasmodium fragile]|uniref:Uncharacterized protein n=1 Tax=Plasmodium fragile TaxID=5857 RepID=A0A0D9QGY1_PLAFR|nr:uncharacterized protein AK88_04184 [Plasmodium fragile]KJP86213.1 hypothetical protein AK88_04184 [Plasmodium fragile]
MDLAFMTTVARPLWKLLDQQIPIPLIHMYDSYYSPFTSSSYTHCFTSAPGSTGCTDGTGRADSAGCTDSTRSTGSTDSANSRDSS